MKEKKESKLMHRIIDTWIDIDAKPEEIWKVLLDFKSWELWNPFIPIVEGNLQVGEHMQIKVVTPGMKPMIFKPEVFEVKPNKKILWGGSFLKILYNGDHAFLLDFLYFAANKIYSPSYVSFESALAYYNLIPEGVFTTTSATTKNTANYASTLGSFSTDI